LKYRIVTHHGLSVGRLSHVELEAVAAMLQAELERGHRIFWNVTRGARAAMSK
jgi:hypothetical protein